MTQYELVLADPAWKYNSRAPIRKDGAKPRFGIGAGGNYTCMDLSEIWSIPVSCMVADRAVLFMWTTGPFMMAAHPILKAWGFEYITIVANWTKVYPKKKIRYEDWIEHMGIIGNGNYTGANAEYLLLGRRGDPALLPTRKLLPSDQRTIQFKTPKYRHSHKPSCIYFLIEMMYPELLKVELFSRGNPMEWDTWGLESEQGNDLLDIEAPWEQLTIFPLREAV